MAAVSGRTGEKCQVSGVYRCSAHAANEIPIAKGDTFPPCSTGSHGTTWILIRQA